MSGTRRNVRRGCVSTGSAGGVVAEQIIAAELHRDDDGQVDRIIFDGRWFQPVTDHDFTYPHRFPVPGPEDPTRLFCDSRCPAWHPDWTYDDAFQESRRKIEEQTALPPELLTPDPDLMASPEGDVKGLRELVDAAKELIRDYGGWPGVGDGKKTL